MLVSPSTMPAETQEQLGLKTTSPAAKLSYLLQEQGLTGQGP